MTAQQTAKDWYWLDHIQPQHRPLIGENAYHLGQALQQGYPVLPGVVVPTTLFHQFLESIDWIDPLFADLPRSSLHIDVDNAQQLQAIAHRIQQLIQAAPLPDSIQAAILSAIEALGPSTVLVQPSLGMPHHSSPRPSAASPSPRLPGSTPPDDLLIHQLCWSDSTALPALIRKVWSSFFQANNLFYWQRLKIPFHHISLAILIQPISQPLASGTLFLRPTEAEVQATWGLIYGLKQGEVTPDVYRLQRITKSLLLQQIGTKRYAYTFHAPTDQRTSEYQDPPESRGFPLIRQIVPSPRSTQVVLPEAWLHCLLDLTQGLMPTDTAVMVEWTVQTTLPTAQRPERELLQLDLANGTHPGDITLPPPPYTFYLTRIQSQFPGRVQIEQTSQNAGPERYSSTPSLRQDNSLAETTSENTPATDGTPAISEAISSPAGVLSGLGTSRGRVTASVWVIEESANRLDTIPSDCIIVAHRITPIGLEAIRSAQGLISEEGGMTSHGAILARELGIPSVMGVAQAMTALQTGDWVILDGNRGTITPISPQSSSRTLPLTPAVPLEHAEPSTPIGTPTVSPPAHPGGISPPPPPMSTNHSSDSFNPHSVSPQQEWSPTSEMLKTYATLESVSQNASIRSAGPEANRGAETATQLMVSLSQAHNLDALAQSPIDGVGLIRSELMLASMLNYQPPETWLERDQRPRLLQTLCYHIRQFAQTFAPRPIWYRTLDLRTPPHHSSQRITVEPNPLLGCHGPLSYRTNPAFFMAELEALQCLQAEGFDNINILLPFVRTVDDFQFCHQAIEQAGLLSHSTCQVWIMAEVPSVLLLLPDYFAAGVQGVAIGSNDLTQLLLAVDRTTASVQQAFDQSHPAVLRALQSIMTTARDARIPCSLCGDIASQHPELIESFIRWGVTTISVNPDAVHATHQEMMRAERRLLLEWGRSHVEDADR